MLASVLNSEEAIKVNINIIRAFVELRKFVSDAESQAREIEEIRKILLLHIENSDTKFSSHETSIRELAVILNNLMDKPDPKRKIGFSE